VPLGTTCPSCRASVRFDAEWCTLCFTLLRAPAPAPAAVPAPAPPDSDYSQPGTAPRHAAPDPLTAPLLDVVMPALDAFGGTPVAAAPAAPVAAPAAPVAPAPVVPGPRSEPTWPCTACGTTNPLAATLCSVCGTPFLAAASSTPKLVLPVVGDLTALSRGQRIVAALGVAAVLMVPVALVTMLMSGGTAPTTEPTPQTAVTGQATP